MNLASWLCRVIGHKFPLIATWRWVHGRQYSNNPHPVGYARALGPRARRREREQARTCVRCRWRKKA